VRDYVGDITLHAKIQSDRPGGRPGKWVKYNSRVVFISSFFCDPKFSSLPETITTEAILTTFDSQDVSPGLLHS